VEVMRGASRSSFIGSKELNMDMLKMLKLLVEGVLGLNGAVVAVKSVSLYHVINPSPIL